MDWTKRRDPPALKKRTCEFCGDSEITIGGAHAHRCDEMNNAIRKRDTQQPKFIPPAPEKVLNKFAEKADIPPADASGRELDPKTGKLVVQGARSGERPQDRIANTPNLGIQNGICSLHGVKHAGPSCPAQIEEVPATAKEQQDEETNG
jgi:hypothetical protein